MCNVIIAKTIVFTFPGGRFMVVLKTPNFYGAIQIHSLLYALYDTLDTNKFFGMLLALYADKVS